MAVPRGIPWGCLRLREWLICGDRCLARSTEMCFRTGQRGCIHRAGLGSPRGHSRAIPHPRRHRSPLSMHGRGKSRSRRLAPGREPELQRFPSRPSAGPPGDKVVSQLAPNPNAHHTVMVLLWAMTPLEMYQGFAGSFVLDDRTRPDQLNSTFFSSACWYVWLGESCVNHAR